MCTDVIALDARFGRSIRPQPVRMVEDGYRRLLRVTARLEDVRESTFLNTLLSPQVMSRDLYSMYAVPHVRAEHMHVVMPLGMSLHPSLGAAREFIDAYFSPEYSGPDLGLAVDSVTQVFVDRSVAVPQGIISLDEHRRLRGSNKFFFGEDITDFIE